MRWKVATTSGKSATATTPISTPKKQSVLGSPGLRTTTPMTLTPSMAGAMVSAPPANHLLSGVASPVVAMNQQVEMKCQCGKPAERLRVKKEGETKGRHFFKCQRRICEYFAWDPTEIAVLRMSVQKEEMNRQAPEISPELTKMKEEFEETKKELAFKEGTLKEKEKTLELAQESFKQGAEQMVTSVVEQAERRHQEVMMMSQAQYQTQLEQLQNQLCWMTAVAGESRIGEVMGSSEVHAQVVQDAMRLKQNLEEQQQSQVGPSQPMRSEGPME